MLFGLFFGVMAVCSVVPAVAFCINLRRFRPPPMIEGAAALPGISVLIPARNEALNIGPALQHVLASRHVALEVLVLDDGSTDGTAEVVRELALGDPRVRCLEGHGLPPGWNGKQYACWTLAQQATQSTLAFLDADVRVAPDLLARMAAFQRGSDAALVSGFPRLITVTWLEQLLLPLIHFVLLAFLPMGSMRRTTRPSVAAGCGQFFLADRQSYFAAGGHNALRETMHDGLLLPRAFRRAGLKTDIADITPLASVRMYDSSSKVWLGLAKNATEGIATPGRIVPLSLILLMGQVAPVVFAAYALVVLGALVLLHFANDGLLLFFLQRGWARLAELFIAAHGGFAWNIEPGLLWQPVALAASLIAAFLPRLLAVRRFRQPLRSALLHPVGILVLLLLQWYALARKLFGRPVGWRQRTYSSGTGAEVGS